MEAATFKLQIRCKSIYAARTVRNIFREALPKEARVWAKDNFVRGVIKTEDGALEIIKNMPLYTKAIEPRIIARVLTADQKAIDDIENVKVWATADIDI